LNGPLGNLEREVIQRRDCCFSGLVCLDQIAGLNKRAHVTAFCPKAWEA